MKIELPNISESFNQTKDFFVEKSDRVKEYISEGTEAAKSSLSELANQSVNSISEAKNQSLEVISKTTDSAASSISEITAQTKEVFTETTQKLTDTATTKTNEAVKSVAEVADNIMQTRESFSYRITEVIQSSLSPNIAEWVNSHPFMVWLLNHPFITLVAGLFLIFILLGLLQVVSNLGKSLFLFILISPFKVFKSIWSLSSKSTSVEEKFTNKKIYIDSSNKIISNRQRLMQILDRLEKIKKEQDLLFEEASKIIKSQSKFRK